MPSRRIWWALMLFALVLRVTHAPLLSIHHGDELWQYLEPAYHLTGGPWVQTWEWRDGVRSWLIPIFLAAPMKLGMWIAPDTQAYILLPRLMLAVLSLGVVHAAMRLGARFSTRHAILAGFVAAIWFELIFFAPRTLSEPIGVALFLPVFALLFDGREQTPRKLAIAGFLLGAVVMVRFQFAPAVLVPAAAVLWRRERAVAWFIAGGIGAVALAALGDWMMGQTPLLWIWNSIHQNLVVNRSASFGVSGPFGFAALVGQEWTAAALALVPLGIYGARRYPLLMAVALVHLAFHSLIPHKEYRFVLLSTTIFVLLAALATVDLVEKLGSGRGAEWRRRAMLGAGAGWFLLSAVTGGVLPFKRHWGEHSALPKALVMAGKTPGSCGLAVVNPQDKLVLAHSFYGRKTPLLEFYGPTALADAQAHAGAFNRMLTPYGTQFADKRYSFVGCSLPVRAGRRSPQYCLWQREGSCSAAPAEYEVNAVMTRLGI